MIITFDKTSVMLIFILMYSIIQYLKNYTQFVALPFGTDPFLGSSTSSVSGTAFEGVSSFCDVTIVLGRKRGR